MEDKIDGKLSYKLKFYEYGEEYSGSFKGMRYKIVADNNGNIDAKTTGNKAEGMLIAEGKPATFDEATGILEVTGKQGKTYYYTITDKEIKIGTGGITPIDNTVPQELVDYILGANGTGRKLYKDDMEDEEDEGILFYDEDNDDYLFVEDMEKIIEYFILNKPNNKIINITPNKSISLL